MQKTQIKVKVRSVLFSGLRLLLSVLYAPMKLLPTRKKVLFLSRNQGDKMSLDFQLVKEALLKEDPGLELVFLNKHLEKSFGSVLGFGWCSLKSMYHLATASVCILDRYWPVVSILKHKSSLTVIQMWHAMGKIKQSGYQTLGRDYGRQKDMAEKMRMHRGYDVVIAGGKVMNPYYCASFGVEEDRLFNIGLPRVDYLMQSGPANREKLLQEYPRLQGKQVVLYAPTFRRNVAADYSEVIARFSGERFGLVVKPHPNQKMKDAHSLTDWSCDKMTTMQILSACDMVITDFSAITFEAASIGKPIYFYLFDYEEYLQKNGVNIDPYQEMPDCVFEDIDQLVIRIESGPYDDTSLRSFARRYLPEELGTSTARLTKLITDCLKDGKHEGIRKNLD